MDKVAVLIPCFNEGKTIEKVVRDFHTVLPEASIYVYDNNSTDDTCAAAERGWEGVIIRKEYKQGKGNVIRRMFREVDARCYIMTDGDDTYPAEYASQMAEAVIERGADMVVGDRLSSTYYTENKRPFHNTGNTLVRKLVNWIFKCEFKDIMTGYRAFSFSFVKGFPVLSGGFEIETEMSIHAADHNLRVENVVVEYRDRPAGSESKLNTFSDGLKVLKTIGRMFRTYRPLIFFGIIALILMALSLGFFIPVFISFLKEGIVRKIPTMIVCGFAVIAALLSLFTGLELETIHSKNKQDFEFQLKVMDLHYKQMLRAESHELSEARED